jgi:hypothetical protein
MRDLDIMRDESGHLANLRKLMSSGRISGVVLMVIGLLLDVCLSAPAWCVEPVVSQTSQEPEQLNAFPAQGQPLPRKTWIRTSSGRYDLFVFTHPGQVLRGQLGSAKDATVMARTGTTISSDRNRTVLHEGCMSLSCRRGSATLIARLASIKVPANAAVVLCCVPSLGTLKISVVAAGRSNVTVRTRVPGSTFVLRKGEEVILSDNQTSRSQACDPQVSQGDLFYGENAAGKPLRILGDDATMFRVSAPDTITLLTGELFFLASYAIKVQTVFTDVLVTRGAMADVDAVGSEVRVKAFNEPLLVSVSDVTPPMEVKQGQELMVFDREKEPSDLNPNDGIGRRRSQRIELGKRLHGVASDFSIMSFLNKAGHLAIIKHPHTDADRDLLETYLKTAAAVQSITGHHGPYQSQMRENCKHTRSSKEAPGA